MDLSVIIVNFNTCNHLKNCLDSLYSFTNGLEFEIIVVDNNSSDRSIEKLAVNYPEAKFLFRDVNDGFGSGCNFGTRNATGKYILFVNPDITISENVNGKLFRFMETYPNAAVVSPVYIEDDSRTVYTDTEFPGYKWEFSEAFGNIISKLSSRIFKDKDYNLSEFIEVNWVMGSYMFIRKIIFNQIHGFDERFFLYYEDIDLQFRIKKLGYKIYYYTNANVMHFKRSSVRSYSGENLYYYHMTRSNLIYMYKHFGFIKRSISKAFQIIGILIRILILPFRKSFANKKRQKLSQYFIKWKQFLSGKKNVYSTEVLNADFLNDDKKQVVHRDSFWK